MKTSCFSYVIFVLALFAVSCQPKQVALTDAQKAAITDSVKAVVQETFGAAQNLNGAGFINRYASGRDVQYIENGVYYPSMDTVRNNADKFYGMLESMTSSIDEFHVIILGPEAAAVSAPFHFSMRTRAGNDIPGQGIYSAVVQLRDGRWQIVQSHESEFHLAELMAALSPAREADEQAIREAENAWSDAMGAKDFERAFTFYAPDAAVLAPNAPIITGSEAIHKAMVEETTPPGYALSWKTDKVEVSGSGDLGYAHGTYMFSFNDAKGNPVYDHGKYVTVWKKQPDGKWKAVADIYNTDLPLATAQSQ